MSAFVKVPAHELERVIPCSRCGRKGVSRADTPPDIAMDRGVVTGLACSKCQTPDERKSAAWWLGVREGVATALGLSGLVFTVSRGAFQ